MDASARVAAVFGRPVDQAPRDVAARLFKVMEQHLDRQDFFAAAHPTMAGLALYAYTAHAPEGGVSLAPYPKRSACATAQRRRLTLRPALRNCAGASFRA